MGILHLQTDSFGKFLSFQRKMRPVRAMTQFGKTLQKILRGGSVGAQQVPASCSSCFLNTDPNAALDCI